MIWNIMEQIKVYLEVELNYEWYLIILYLWLYNSNKMKSMMIILHAYATRMLTLPMKNC